MHGPALNPHRSPSRVDGMISEQRSAGGSSGGSAAAVASGTCYARVSMCELPITLLMPLPQCTWNRYRWICATSSDVLRCRWLETIIWANQQVR